MIEYFSDKGIPCIQDNRCNRCGSNNLFYNDNELYCRDCINYGFSSSNKYLEYKNIVRDYKYSTINLDYELSDAQLKASSFVLDHISNFKDCLVHAVCGAGKTEIIFESIKYAINNKYNICIAIPRTEVVKEIGIRLKEVFTNNEVCILYGEKSFYKSDILVCTCNKLINFKDEFDFIIIDEVDAFPYYVNDFLEKLVYKSLRSKHSICYLSATPQAKLLTLDRFLLPARYHRKPLPVPKYINNQNSVYKFLNTLNSDKQVILYVDSYDTGNYLKGLLKSKRIESEFIYSKSYNKTNLLNRFKDKQFPVLISTILLERGITIANIDVVVMNADKFSKDSLIQISGRVGRKINFEYGNILLYSNNYTTCIKESISEIKYYNKIAKKQGYLDE